MLISTVDVIFADVAQPDQTQSVALNAHIFLQNGGHFVISIKANGIDSTASAEAVFASEVKKMQQENMKPQEQANSLMNKAMLWFRCVQTTSQGRNSELSGLEEMSVAIVAVF